MENKKFTEKVNMQPLVSVLTSLTASGFETQFKATKNGLLSLATEKIFQPGEVKVIHFYRFEGESNPADNSILYAIETNDGVVCHPLEYLYDPESMPTIKLSL